MTGGDPFHGGGSLLSGATLIAAQSEHDGEGGTAQADDLSEDEQAVVDDLKERDREVRAHEAAHANAGGGIAGSPSYEYEVGPDGRRYAVGGEVRIDTSPVSGDPEATIEKMETVINAALAPAEPSGQDRAVAARAMAQLREAQAEAASNGRQERETPSSGEEDPSEPQEPQPQVQRLVI